MKPSEEQRLGQSIIAALERVRQHVCQTGAAGQWHVAKATNLVRKPSLLERLVPHLEGDAAKSYLVSLPGWIEETKNQDSACGVLWNDRETDNDPQRYKAERKHLVELLVRYDFSLRSYEKLARQPNKLLAELTAHAETGSHSDSNGNDQHDENGTRMTEQEFADLEELIHKELRALDEARASLVAAHDSLVVKCVEKSGDLSEEATSCARHGLAKAAENFDVRRGFRFATYARWWIKTAIKEKKTWNG